MKIGIITFHRALNCGAALQAWALQTYLRKQRLDAEIVNYGKIGWPGKYYLKCDSLKHFVGSFYNGFFTFFRTFGIESYRRHLYRRFQREQMGLGAAVSKNSINDRGYSHLIAGSDQIWHPVINEGDDAYFLANVPDGVKRISYAPSFGIDAFEPELERKMAGWLSCFDALSAREPEGAAIVKRLTGRDVPVVCDPTMLLFATDYCGVKKRPRFVSGEFVLLYTVGDNNNAVEIAKQTGRRLGMPVVHLVGGYFARWYACGAVHKISAVGPSEFLWLLNRAKYVVTNSFHGTVFSLLFHSEFTAVLNGNAADSRMKNLCGVCGMEHRISSDKCIFEGYGNHADWHSVDIAIEKQRRNGAAYLFEALT